MNLFTPQEATPRTNNRTSLGWCLAIALPFLAIAAAFAFYTVFSRKEGDDEGYLMITVLGFIEGNPLYDSVFTQYGPFYYFYEWLLRKITSMPLTHDTTRMLCIVHWLGAAVALGVAGGILTRSFLGGIFVFMQAIVHLTNIANEPGHPQDIVALLLAVGMAVAARGLERFATLELLAVIGAALALIKVNVGAFFCFALFLALRCHACDRLARGVWNWLLLAVCALAPVLLMRRHLTVPWCRNYTVLAAVTILTTLAVAQVLTPKCAIRSTKYGSLALCILLPGLAAWAVLAWLGTSMAGLIDGLLLIPLQLPHVALLPKMVPNGALLNAAVALAVAAHVLWATRQRIAPTVLLLGKAVYGVLGAVVFVSDVNAQFDFLFPWAWLILVPASPRGPRGENCGFARVFLCLAVAWQSLQAYPIAGTQAVIATLLLVLVYTLCLADTLAAFRVDEHLAGRLRLPLPRTTMLVRGVALLSLFAWFALSWCRLPALHRAYASLTPLGLPGSKYVRLTAEATLLYQSLMQYLEANSDTFITYPGNNSFYFWTGKRPPTQLNGTGWGLFTHAQQEQILQSLLRSKRPLLVVHEFMVRSWEQGVPSQISPLVRCVREQCREVKRVGPFVIFAPRNGAETGR